ncbi:hypothetical protein Pla52o_53420 [Novipirellula galeiformis]|uniref:Bacterial Pleckstrin homology domain-containing protein n=1 Tax=Novipirellula galeiformis TaxID=2528004 RepID=A0A5C6C1E5_9BACT|nr:hypothetical protein [Novipirellula galeiformis]TWU17336.1 hypothetical protein Pla52o_53420 [Novipirellula galeiformis]
MTRPLPNPNSRSGGYFHKQRAPLCLLLYALGMTFLLLSWFLRNQAGIEWIFLVVGGLVLVVAASFHHLVVQDEGERISIHFGPIPLFRRDVRYEDIRNVEVGRTTFLDGWGIHVNLPGTWVWNLWGRDCVVLRLRKGVLKIGTDDPQSLADFLNDRRRPHPDADRKRELAEKV